MMIKRQEKNRSSTKAGASPASAPPTSTSSASLVSAQTVPMGTVPFAAFSKALTTWVPFVTSLISFVIAIYTFVITTQQPEILTILPDQIRIAQGADYGFAYLYFQPTFVHTGESQRMEVIRNLRLEVRGASDGATATFVWDEQGKLLYDQSAERSLSYEYVADPSPLLVSPNSAQSPFCTFNGPSNWYFAPGNYQITFAAERAVTGELLTANFTVTFTPENIDFLNTSQGQSFLTFPIKNEE